MPRRRGEGEEGLKAKVDGEGLEGGVGSRQVKRLKKAQAQDASKKAGPDEKADEGDGG